MYLQQSLHCSLQDMRGRCYLSHIEIPQIHSLNPTAKVSDPEPLTNQDLRLQRFHKSIQSCESSASRRPLQTNKHSSIWESMIARKTVQPKSALVPSSQEIILQSRADQDSGWVVADQQQLLQHFMPESFAEVVPQALSPATH